MARNMTLSMARALLVCLVLCDGVIVATAKNLRLRAQPHLDSRPDVPIAVVAAVAGKDSGDVVFEVMNKTSLKSEDSTECLCALGSFWHWRINKCVDQGSWGYECGFFPREHWHRVCNDNLQCEALKGAEDNYVWHGRYEGEAHSFPASCKNCTEGDNCTVGQARHDEECLKQYTVSGEACTTVKITFPKGVVEKSACCSAEEATEAVGVANATKVNAVTATKILAKADAIAFDRATEFALDAAKEKGFIDGADIEKQLAEAIAAERAEMKANALTAEAASWATEAGDNEAAKAAAKARAEAMAEKEAKLEAELEAEAEAAKAAADKAEAAVEAAREKGADVEAAQERADAAKAAAAKAKSAAAAQKRLLDVISPKMGKNAGTQEVPKATPEEPKKFRKITEDEMAAKLP